jgi:hypothetical protein
MALWPVESAGAAGGQGDKAKGYRASVTIARFLPEVRISGGERCQRTANTSQICKARRPVPPYSEQSSQLRFNM